MMGEARHLNRILHRIIASGERNAQNSGGNSSIFAISFIEIATTKQQQSLGMLCFHREKLLHHGRQALIICCHNPYFEFIKILELTKLQKFNENRKAIRKH